MPTRALQLGVPVTSNASYVGTGAVTGEVLAVPMRTGKSPSISVIINFSADPGVSVFNVMASNDGVNFALQSTINNAVITPNPTFGKIDVWEFLFIRIDQLSKTNAVTATVSVMAS